MHYLQALATEEVKYLADNLHSETARAALQGIVGCAGGVASGNHCTASALGAAASVVVNHLLDTVSNQDSILLSPEEKEARSHIVATLITGTAEIAGGDAASVATASQIETENNALFVPALMGAAWIADKGFTAYEVYSDLKAVEAGTMTLEELAAQKGEEYVARALVGNLGKYGLKGIKQGGKWVAEKLSKNVRITKKKQTIDSAQNASNVNSQAALNKKMRALESAQKKSVKIQKLSDGRIRYYEAERPSKIPGPTRGSSYVTEFNPKTGQVRSWNECYDQQGNVNRVHPKSLDGQDLKTQHYPPTKVELESFSKKPGGPR